MYVGNTLFAQVMEFVPWTSFARIVQRYSGNAGVRTLSCAEQFRAMAFAQLTWRESLRDIEASLSANSTKLYAMGFRSAVKRSTLADANESRDWRIWSDLAALLIRRARAQSSAVGLQSTYFRSFFLEGHRGDGAVVAFVIGPGEARIRRHVDIPAEER